MLADIRKLPNGMAKQHHINAARDLRLLDVCQGLRCRTSASLSRRDAALRFRRPQGPWSSTGRSVTHLSLEQKGELNELRGAGPPTAYDLAEAAVGRDDRTSFGFGAWRNLHFEHWRKSSERGANQIMSSSPAPPSTGCDVRSNV